MWSGTNPVKSQGHLSRQGLSSGLLEGNFHVKITSPTVIGPGFSSKFKPTNF